jgi:hypothetical protein
MPKSKLSQIQVSGLATNPNPNALPAGSCAVASNVVSRRPGVLTPCPTSTALATIDSINFTTGKGLWSDADNGVVAVLPQNVDENAWVPGTDETQIGELVCYEVNQTAGAVPLWELTELQIGKFADYTYRDIGFIPGITHATYSHFRTLITEKWGTIVSDGQGTSTTRWAGLVPPVLERATNTVSTDYPWFIDGNSVLYRAHYSLESRNPEKPFNVVGPVSNVLAAYATDTGYATVYAFISREEPYLTSTADYDVYLNLYRSSQDDVESAQDLPLDFQLVYKLRLGDAYGDPSFITDKASDLARAKGVYLYTNAEQEGEQSSSYCPPSARDVAVFRDTAFYANRAFLPELTVSVSGPLLDDVSGDGLFSQADKTSGIGTRKVLSLTLTSGSAVVTTASSLTGIVPGQLVFLAKGSDSMFTSIVTVGSGTFTVADVWPYTSGATGFAIVQDAYKIHVYYADGTDELFYNVVTPLSIFTSSLYSDYPPTPGLRIFGPFPYYPLPAYGREVTFIFTYPAIKRVLYFELFLTNGQNYSPAYTGDFLTETDPLKSLNDTRPNRLFFSKTGQPEAVPLANYIDVGAGTILKMAPTQSALLLLCTDGLWRVTGDGTSWQVNQIDPTVTLLHPDCLTSLNNQIYGWVEDGLSLIGEDGAQTISTDAVGPDIRDWATQIKNWGAPYFWGPCLAGDRFWNEVWLNVYRAHSSAAEFTAVTTLVYNTDTKNFTRLQAPFFSSLQYSQDANRMISQVFIPGSPTNQIALTVQSDFYDPAGDGWLPVTVWFNALQTDDKGKLKQWMDVNYFIADVETTVGADTSYLQARFDARNTSTDATAYPANAQSMVALSRDVHFWVPRRTALSDQQQLGLVSFVVSADNVPDTTAGFNFQLQGFTVRYRNASDTLKR